MGWRAVEEVLDQISTQLTPNGCPLLVLFLKCRNPIVFKADSSYSNDLNVNFVISPMGSDGTKDKRFVNQPQDYK